MKTIKITADGKVSIIDVDLDDYEAIQQAVGGYPEAVSTKWMFHFFKRPVVMLINKEGCEKELEFNPLGTAFYDLTPVEGDIILAQPADTYGKLEGIGEPEETVKALVEHFKFLQRT